MILFLSVMLFALFRPFSPFVSIYFALFTPFRALFRPFRALFRPKKEKKRRFYPFQKPKVIPLPLPFFYFFIFFDFLKKKQDSSLAFFSLLKKRKRYSLHFLFLKSKIKKEKIDKYLSFFQKRWKRTDKLFLEVIPLPLPF